jgi:hypothetical protein
MEEEINLLQEIYFNTCFGPNQLKNNYLIDWELQTKEVEVQEYFFNIKDNFITLRHTLSKAKISADLPTEVECALKEIEISFVNLISSTLQSRTYQPSEQGISGQPSESPFSGGGIFAALATPMINLQTAPPTDNGIDIGMTKKELADLLLGKKKDHHEYDDPDEKQFHQLGYKHSDSAFSLHVSLPKLTAILKSINALITRPDLKKHRSYIEVKTGSIIERASKIVKLKQEKLAQTMNADEWDDLKSVLSDLVFDSRIYLSMFSKEFICYLIEVMPEHSIKELVKATIGLVENETIGDTQSDSIVKSGFTISTEISNSRPYKKSFNKLIKAYYRWVLKSTKDFEEQRDSQKDNFYKHAISVLKFFDRMVIFNKHWDPTLIQSEIIYFDFLFAMYTYSNAADLLKSYCSSSDKSPKLGSAINNFFIRLRSMPSTFIPENISKETGTDLKVDFIYLMALLSSMKLATNRFFTTEHSHLLKTGINDLVNDLLEFSKQEEISFESRDGSTNVRDENLDFGDGYLNLLQNEKKLQREKRMEYFLKDATSNMRMENRYYYMLYNLVIRLQTNLLINTDENLLNNKAQPNYKMTSVGKFDLPWRPAEEKLIDLARNNLSPILSDCFLSKKNHQGENAIFLSTVKSVTHQMLTMVKKFEIASFVCEEDNSEEVEKMKIITKRLFELENVLYHLASKLKGKTLAADDSSSHKFVQKAGDKIKTSYQSVLSRLLNYFEEIDREFKLGFEPEEFRRASLHSDPSNMEMLSILTKYSRKYNMEAADSTECYYKAIMSGRVEMEVDAGMLNRGLARSFIKIFNKMLMNQPNYERRFRKIATNIKQQVDRSFDFLFDEEYKRLTLDVINLRHEKEYLYNQKALDERGLPNPQLEERLEKTERLLFSKERKLQKISNQIEAATQFVLAYETNYFYNEVYTKAMIIYEKLIDELPELKGNIYNESFKNKGLINFEVFGPGFRSTYPYLHNLYTLSLQYTYHLMTSMIFNGKWGISMSRLFITLSLINNLTLDNYQGFKQIYADTQFNDLQLKLFKEKEEDDIDEKSKEDSNLKKPVELHRERLKPLLESAKEFEEKESLIVSVCCRIQYFLSVYEFHDPDKLISNFDSSIVTTGLPILTMWINFLDGALVSDDSVLMEKGTAYVYNKLFSRYLLKMLFKHEDMTSVEVIYMKKSISSLLFKIIKNPSILDDLLKYHLDLRSIYDYTIKITKVHVAALICTDPSEKIAKWLKNNDERRLKVLTELEQGNNMVDLVKIISSGVQDIATKISKSRFSYDKPQHHHGKKSSHKLVANNSNLFGGYSFCLVQHKEHQKDLEKYTDLSLEEIMECYKKSDNRDLGFQFINSLVKLMGYIEFSTGLKLWSAKKENARIQFEVEMAKLPKVKLHELKMAYFLSKINKQIEIVTKEGKNILINFRKYPEIYTLESLDPLELIPNFKFEDFKRDVCKIVPDLFVKTSIQYSIQQKMGGWYTYMKSDNIKKHPVILWLLALIVNLIIFTGYENLQYRDDTHRLRSTNYKVAETVLAIIIMIYSLLTTFFWLSARYYAIRNNKNMPNMSELNSAKKSDTSNLLELKGIFGFITENPYFSFIFEMIFNIDTFSLLLHFVFAAIGYFVHKMGYVGGICMFAFFNQTTRNLLKAIASNWLDLVLTLVLIFIVAYIYSILTYYYYYDTFASSNFPKINKPCYTLYTCFANTLNYGIRMGGGIGEVLKYQSENSSHL